MKGIMWNQPGWVTRTRKTLDLQRMIVTWTVQSLSRVSHRKAYEVYNSVKDSLVEEVNEDFRLFGAVDDSVPSGGTNEGLLKLFKLRFKAREGQPWTDDKDTQLKKDAFYAELLVVKPYFKLKKYTTCRYINQL
jgi:hypothetical protein